MTTLLQAKSNDVLAAMENMERQNHGTTFSQWYKGEHGKAEKSLKAALRALAQEAKGNDSLVKAAKDALAEVVGRNGGYYQANLRTVLRSNEKE